MMPLNATSAGPDGSATGAAALDEARLEWLWSEYERQMEESKQYQALGQDIFPQPGFVIKTFLHSAPSRPVPQFPTLSPEQLRAAGAGPGASVQNRIKFFVNVCSDPAIELPHMQPAPDGTEQLRVPLSLGPVHQLAATAASEADDPSTSNAVSLVTDVVLNPASVAQCAQDKDFRSFLASFILQKVEAKYKLKLKTDPAAASGTGEHSVKFPKLKYKGTLPPPPHHIRRTAAQMNKATIEEEKEVPTPAALNRRGVDGEVEHDNSMIPTEAERERRAAAAKEARLKALREEAEREHGIRMPSSAPGSSNHSVGPTSSAGEPQVFLTEEAAVEARQKEWEAIASGKFPTSHDTRPSAVAATTSAAAKIEVIEDTPTQHPGALAAAASSASTAAAPSPATPASSSSSPNIPSYSIYYLKASSASSSSTPSRVPAHEWDLSLPLLPQSIELLISLPGVSRGSEMELNVVEDAGIIELQSVESCRNKHSWQMHVQLPFVLDESGESARCSFSKKNQTMTIIMPVKDKRKLEEEAEREDGQTAAASTSKGTTVTSSKPMIDWSARLGLTNTLMYQLASDA